MNREIVCFRKQTMLMYIGIYRSRDILKGKDQTLEWRQQEVVIDKTVITI